MITKIQKTEYLFILCYCLFFISLFIDDVAFINFDCSIIVKIMKFLVMILSTFLLLKQKWEKEDFLKIFLTISFGALILFFTGDFFWLIIIMMAFASRTVDKKVIFRASIFLIIALSLIVILLCLIGVLPDIYTYRSNLSDNMRHSFGFMHSASLPLCIFYLSTYYVMIDKNMKSKRFVLLFLSFLSIILFKLCGSRNAFYLTILTTSLVVLESFFYNKKIIMKFLNILSKYIFIICAAVSILPGLLRYYGIFSNFWYSFDTIFTNRSLLFSSAINTYGIHFLNNMSYSEFTNQTVLINSIRQNGVVLDSAYVYMLIRYGVVILIFLWFVFKALYKKNSGSYSGCLIIILIALANIIDNDLLSYGALPFMLIGIRYLWTKPKNDEMDGVNNGFSKCNS